jgi:hypothetical protein
MMDNTPEFWECHAIRLFNELCIKFEDPSLLSYNYYPLDSTDFYCQDAIFLNRTHHPHSRILCRDCHQVTRRAAYIMRGVLRRQDRKQIAM